MGTLANKPKLNTLEMIILLYMTQGFKTKAIASYMQTTEGVTRNRMIGIYEKIGATNRVEAVIIAIKRELCAPFSYYGA